MCQPALFLSGAQLDEVLPFARRVFFLLAQFIEQHGALLLQSSAVDLDFVLHFLEAATTVVEMSGELGFLLFQALRRCNRRNSSSVSAAC